MKVLSSSVASDNGDPDGVMDELIALGKTATPKRKQANERVATCPPHCDHKAPLPSDIMIEMKVSVTTFRWLFNQCWPDCNNTVTANSF